MKRIVFAVIAMVIAIMLCGCRMREAERASYNMYKVNFVPEMLAPITFIAID